MYKADEEFPTYGIYAIATLAERFPREESCYEKALMRQKQQIIGKILDVAKGDDEKKMKEQKIKAMYMVIRLIEMEIARLKQKKTDLEKGKPVLFQYESDRLPPSLSDLIHP